MHAPQVLEVLRIYKHYNKYNLDGSAPAICHSLNDIRIELINEALQIFSQKAIKEGKAPHPNYFVSICLRLHKQQGGIHPIGKLI